MFWRTEAAFQTSSLATLLDKPDVNLTDIMNDEYILQEIKCGNKRLTDYLMKPENLIALTKLCVTEPENVEDERKKYKYAHLASEILSAGSEILTEALAKNAECYVVLANFVRPYDLGDRQALNPLLASFFNKVLGLMITRHVDQVLSYMQENPAFLDNIIDNLDTSALAETLFRLACCGEDDKNGRLVKEWLSQKSFIPKLISQLDISKSDEAHGNVTFLLCELIRALRRDQFARDSDPLNDKYYVDPLVTALESREILDDLLDRTLAIKDDSKYSDSVTANGCAVFISLLQTVLNARNPLNFIDDSGKYDPNQTESSKDDDFARIAASNRPIGVMWEPDPHKNAEQCLATGLLRVKKLLETSKKDPILLPMGQVDTPLGTARLALTQLLAQMLANGHPNVHEACSKLDLMGILIELFFKHKWNNFLHTNVVNCLICAMYGQLGDGGSKQQEDDDDDFDDHSASKRVLYASPLLKQILDTHHLLKMIVDKQKEASEMSGKPGSITPPYIGHVMRLAVCAYYALRDGPNSAVMKETFGELPEAERQAWYDFVDAQILPYMKRNEPDLVGPNPNRDDDGMLTDHTEDVSTSNIRNRVRMPVGDMASMMATSAPFDIKDSVSASDFLKDEPMDQAAFESMCEQRPGDDDDDVWAEKEITFQKSTVDAAPPPAAAASAAGSGMDTTSKKKRTSSSSDEEDMEVDKEPTAWVSSAPASKPLASENWASFDEEWTTSANSGEESKKQLPDDPFAAKKTHADDDDWASFDQTRPPTSSTIAPAFAAAAEFPDDPWAKNESGGSSEVDKKGQSQTGSGNQ